MLGTILGSRDPRAQGIIANLQEDDVARDILERVDQGPFGPGGRTHEHANSQEAFVAAVTQPFIPKAFKTDGTGRDSRVTREIVSAKSNRGINSINLSCKSI